jgi:hypothetical protein
MPLPWLRALDLTLRLVELVRRRKVAGARDEESPGIASLALPAAGIAGIVDAAVSQALNRNAGRIELERERRDAERLRAERAARLAAIRHAADHELGRLRLLTAVAVASWIGTLLAATRLAAGAVGARVAMGGAWLLLLAAMVLSFAAQARVSDLLARADEGGSVAPGAMRGVLGPMTMAFVVAGLAMAGLAILV